MMIEICDSILFELKELADLELDDLRHGYLDRAKSDLEAYKKLLDEGEQK